MLDGANVWDLVVRRAETTPDREMAVDQDGERLLFGEYRDRCEAAEKGKPALPERSGGGFAGHGLSVLPRDRDHAVRVT